MEVQKIPLVSVVIPLYNKEPHIKRAIYSVLAQKVQDIEIIIVDDGSTDKSAEVVKSFTDLRIRLIQQENSGVSAARNRGIEEAKADLIAFLDADDEWTPSFLKIILRLREKYPEAGAYSTAYSILKYGNIKPAKYNSVPSAPWEGLIPRYFLTAATGNHPICSSAVCIPRDIFKEIGGFPEEAWYGEDADVFGKIALKYPIAFSWCLGGVYHQEAVNRACNRQIPLEEEPFVKTAKKAIKENLVPPDKVEDLKEYIAKKEILRAGKYLSAGKKKVAMQILKDHKTKYHRHKKLTLMIAATIPNPMLQRIIKIRRLLKD